MSTGTDLIAFVASADDVVTVDAVVVLVVNALDIVDVHIVVVVVVVSVTLSVVAIIAGSVFGPAVGLSLVLQ